MNTVKCKKCDKQTTNAWSYCDDCPSLQGAANSVFPNQPEKQRGLIAKLNEEGIPTIEKLLSFTREDDGLLKDLGFNVGQRKDLFDWIARMNAAASGDGKGTAAGSTAGGAGGVPYAATAEKPDNEDNGCEYCYQVKGHAKFCYQAISADTDARATNSEQATEGNRQKRSQQQSPLDGPDSKKRRVRSLMTFQNREEAAAQVAEAHLSNLENQHLMAKFMQESDEKGFDTCRRSLKIIMCNMMFGAGKSRLGEELPRMIHELGESTTESIDQLQIKERYKSNLKKSKENLPTQNQILRMSVNLKYVSLRDHRRLVPFLVTELLALILNASPGDFSVWRRQNIPPVAMRKDRYAVLYDLGCFIKFQTQKEHVLLHIDELGRLLTYDFADYYPRKTPKLSFEEKVQRAESVWQCLLRFLHVPGFLVFCTGKDTSFYSLAMNRVDEMSSPSALRLIPLNPLDERYIWNILETTEGLRDMKWVKSNDIHAHFVKQLYAKTAGEPLLLDFVLDLLLRAEDPGSELKDRASVDSFLESVSDALRDPYENNAAIFAPISSLHEQSDAFIKFYISMLASALYHVPIDPKQPINLEPLGLGDRRVDLIEAVDMLGFYVSTAGDDSHVVVPPYSLELVSDLRHNVGPFFPRDLEHSIKEFTDPSGRGHVLERMTRQCLKYYIFAPLAVPRTFSSIPWLADTCIKDVVIPLLAEHEIELPKLIGARDDIATMRQIRCDRTVAMERNNLAAGVNLSQCHWSSFDLVNEKLISDNALCHSRPQSHGGDEQIRLEQHYHLIFQDKNLAGSALTAKLVQSEADKVYKSVASIPGAKGVLVLVALTIGPELVKESNEKDYIYYPPNARCCGYVLPNLEVVILMKAALEVFLGKANMAILAGIATAGSVSLQEATQLTLPFVVRQGTEPNLFNL